MMESCFNYKTERVESVVVEDLKKDLFADFSAITSTVPQDSTPLEKEHLRVYLRIRPFTSTEIDNGESQECVALEPPDIVLLKAPRMSMSARLSDKSVTQTVQRFQFSQVYGPETTQKDMFDGTVRCLVKDVLEGGNSLVFTYGVTNAGKTFTFLGPDSDGGILPRSLNVIFNSIEDRIYTQMNVKPHRCREFTRLTKDQQDEEATNKRNIMRLFKESDSQKSTASQLSSTLRGTLLEGSTMSDAGELVDADSFSLNVGCHTKFSVWVSFCEIYNENIHDLLEPISTGSLRRTVLRLSQDVKGNSFVKDLKWIQVNDADEAYKVLKLGKKNQSFSCTKLNSLSSRSHSVFSIRILRIEDVGIPRVHMVSELSLCDLAGSERCAKTHNKGDRLKEAGNINTSLLILGKCINALRHNQQSKLQQHVPFRESKLTHYLQGFFCGRGKACMIVNINQCASMYDETLNVLKFSAVAQKVVVLNTKPLPVIPKRSGREVSLIINNADQKNFWAKRKSSLVGWDTTLEDVQEKDDDEDGDFEEETCDESAMEVTIQEADEGDEEIDKELYENLLLLVEELKKKLHSEESDKLTLESRVREEVTKEFMELFSKMESDYSERLLKEKEIIEERAERRLEILRNLVSQNADVDEALSNPIAQSKEKVFLDGMMDAIQDDLAGIKKVAEAAQTCLVASSDPRNPVADFEKQLSELTEDLHKAQQLLDQKTSEVETMHVQLQQTNDQLKEANKNLESQAQKFQELMDICQEKDEMISKLQTAMDHQVETTTNDRNFIETVKKEILELKKNCKCLNKDGESMAKECRKRLGDVERDLDGQPPLKKGLLNEDHVMTVDGTQQLQADCKQKELEIMQLREKYAGLQQQLESIRVDFQSELKLKDQQMGQLKQEHLSLQNDVYKLNDRLKQQACASEAAQSSLEVERQEKIKLVKENETMANEICELRRSSEETASKITALDCELSALRERSEKVSADLRTAKVLLVEHNNSSRQKSKTIESLTQEAQQLREEMETSRASLLQGNCGQFRDTMGALHQECEKVVKDSAQKSRQIQDLNQEVCQLRCQLAEQEELSGQLKQELVNFQEKAQTDLMCFEAERRTAAETAKRQSELEAEAAKLKGTVALLQEQLETSAASVARVAELEKKLAEEAQVAALKEMQDKLADARAPSPPSLVEARHKEAERRRELLKVAEEAIAQKDAELERKEQQLSKLRKEVISGSDKVKSLSLDLQRKEDDTADLKEKLADSKRQIQQVEKEVASMREEEKSLRRKLNDSEKMKAQLLSSLSSKDQAIHQLKSASSAKSDENLQLYQKACDDITAKEQVIENMRLALSEQEETQQEQDQVLEAKLDEIESLNQELRKLKERFLKQNSDDHKDSRMLRDCHSDECKQAIQNTNAADDRLTLVNEKHQSDKKKWLEEKLILISQAKEAEERRNQEMRRFADDRERFGRVQIEAESLSKQLSEKNEDLLKWRKERDALVAALEIQMQRLKASNAEKDQKLKELQQNRNSRPLENINKEEELQQLVYEKDAEIMLLKEQLKVFSDNAKETNPVSQKNSRLRNLNGSADKIDVPFKKPLEDNELKGGISSSRSSEENEVSVLDSSEISTENGRGSRFPKPQLEIQFTSLQPNKLNVKRQDGDSSVTVKITRSAKKRKSPEMEKDPVESENRKNSRCRPSRMLAQCDESPATPSKKINQMKSQESQSSLRNRRDGTLQKIGDFFQSSPNLLGSKAKKIIGLMSPKSPELEGGTSLSFKPKKPKRKLYKTEISSPLDIPSHPIICHDQDDKESDHLIIKRRLRSRTAKK